MPGQRDGKHVHVRRYDLHEYRIIAKQTCDAVDTLMSTESGDWNSVGVMNSILPCHDTGMLKRTDGA